MEKRREEAFCLFFTSVEENVNETFFFSLFSSERYGYNGADATEGGVGDADGEDREDEDCRR